MPRFYSFRITEFLRIHKDNEIVSACQNECAIIIGSLAFECHREVEAIIEDQTLVPLLDLLCFNCSSSETGSPLILSITRAIRNIVKCSRASRNIPFQVNPLKCVLYSCLVTIFGLSLQNPKKCSC